MGDGDNCDHCHEYTKCTVGAVIRKLKSQRPSPLQFECKKCGPACEPCQFWRNGSCNDGDNCKYCHVYTKCNRAALRKQIGYRLRKHHVPTNDLNHESTGSEDVENETAAS